MGNYLWGKLTARFLTALKGLYSKVNCAINVNNELTGWFGVDSWVKQGCILSPTLFAMFIDDLVESLNTVHAGVDCGGHLILADDIVILAPIEAKLEKLIRVVESWCQRWNMALNPSKTKVVHLRNEETNQDPIISSHLIATSLID
jgi:uncharacterized membrane protein YhdT